MDTQNDLEFEIQWREILIARLSKPLTNLNKSVETERTEAVARQNDIRGLYPTEEEAHEAFGYGEITEDEYREIAENLEAPDLPTTASAARDELKDILSRLRREIRDFKWEMLSESEREAIRQSNADYKTRLKGADTP